VAPGGGRLVVNEQEAERVRAIFARFEEMGSLQQTLPEIERRGWRLKSWTCKTGEFHTGGPFTLSALRRLLSNILYTGAVRHQGKVYPGEHAVILARDQWERVQSLLPQSMQPRGGMRNKHQALLQGLLHCECCAAPMVYSYAAKGGRKYPYYVCRSAQKNGWATCPSKSLPAQAIEESVLGRVREGMDRATPWKEMDRQRQREIVEALVERVGYNGTTRQISVRFRTSEAGMATQEARA